VKVVPTSVRNIVAKRDLKKVPESKLVRPAMRDAMGLVESIPVPKRVSSINVA